MLRARSNKTRYRINLSDPVLNFVISYQKLRRAIPKLPYILNFKNSKSNFVYIGIKHSNNPKNIQFNKIESLFRKFLKSNRNKKLVVGIENIYLYNSDDNLSKNQLIKKYGESGLLTYLAKKNSLPEKIFFLFFLFPKCRPIYYLFNRELKNTLFEF